ncbi:ABC transporter ATP-binding protein [Pseudactinotalea sp.]|uniref:ABC transporter ATP-binding protein n=1 Tax=Pseudactinotalea sp. TaxID=1926260 RepID=UPI003B3A5971
MTATEPQARARSPFGRRRSDDGPRASLRELLPYLVVNRGLLIAALILSVLGAATSLAQPLLVQQVIDRVQAAAALGWLPWLLVGLVVADALLAGYQHYLLQVMGEQVVRLSRRRLVARILHLPIATFDTRRTGDLVSRVGSDTTLLRAVLTQGLVESVGGLLTFVGAVIAMIIIDPLLFALTLGVVVLAFGLAGAVMPMLTRASAQAQEQVGALSSALERAISGVRTIRAANAGDREAEVIDERTEGAYRAGIKVARVSALVVPIAGVALQVAFLVVLGVGGARVAAGELSIAALVGFLMFLFLLVMPLAQMIGAMSAVSQALGALGRIQEIVRLPIESDDDVTTSVSPRTDGPAIAFEGVSFRYPSGEQAAPVLDDVTFAVPRGSRTALVGPSGAGKSTVFALVERFYDPTGGRVLAGGVDVREVARTDLRSGIGYVEQDAPVLAGSLADNLRLASPDASDEQMRAVLAQVNLSDVLTRSPAGLDAPVGEHGVMLSGGERQRLAIARALLNAPDLLLLDESTSSLDSRNEAQLRSAIDEVAAGRTLLVIAHRLSTVVDSDQIVVLDHGQVVATGTHADLLQSSPLYRELAQHQLLAPTS